MGIAIGIAGAGAAKQIPIPSLALKMVLTDGKINDARRKLQDDIEEKVSDLAAKRDDDIEAQVADMVSREIDSLSEINQM
ncbi:MAG: hypothetical protein HN350_20290 [Phycisphaerales bacterium]|nr:hypothetical protein [Phycisphaerales bacterium]